MKFYHFLILSHLQILQALIPRLRQSSFNVEISQGSIVNKKIINETYLEANLGLQEYKLISVKGFKVDGDKGFDSTSPPHQCDQKIPATSPGNLFCIDRQNGAIYTLEQTTRTYVGGQTYNLTIQWTNATFRKESTTYFIQINFEDSCKAVGKSYFELNFKRQCSRFLQPISFQTSKEKYKGSNTFFGLSLEGETRILGFKLSKLLFENTTKTFQIQVKESTTKSKTYTFPINVDDDHNLEIFIPAYVLNEVQGSKENMFFFNIMGRDSSGTNTVIITPGSSVNLLYSLSWDNCKEQTCVSKYKNWNSSLALTSEPSCERDESFYQEYYGRCTDLNPVFTTSPGFDGGSLMQGCNYNSIFDLQEFTYFLINGTKRVKEIQGSTVAPSRSKRAINVRFSTFSTQDILMIQNYDHVGEIKCGIFDPDRMKAPVLSNSTVVTYEAPVFTKDLAPTVYKAVAGESFQLLGCSFKKDARLELRLGEALWLKDGKPYRNATVEKEKFADLFVKIAKVSETGTYQCSIKAGALSQIFSSSSSVIITEIIVQFIEQPRIGFDILSRLTISGCKFNVSHGTVDTFLQESAYYELTNIQGSSKRLPVLTTEGPIKVSNYTMPPYQIVGFDAFGQYKCAVFDSNRMSAPVNSNSINTNEFLPKFGAPKIQILKREYNAGESLVMTIKITMLFPLKGPVYWVKDGKRFGDDIKSTGAKGVSPFSTLEYTLVFKSLTLNDSGSYSCKLSNPFPIESGRTNITVTAVHVEFTNLPSLQIQSNSFYIGGCDFTTSTFNDDIGKSTYVLFNGTRLNRTEPVNIITPSKRKRRMAEEGILSIFPRFRVQSYVNGFYQCVVYDPNIMENPVVSDATFIKIPEPQFEPTFPLPNITVDVLTRTAMCPCIFRIGPMIQPKEDEYYYLKDGAIKIPAQIEDPQIPVESGDGEGSRPPDSNDCRVTRGPQPHIIEEIRFKDEGSYQCVFHPKGLQPIKSKKWFIKVNGIQFELLSPPFENLGVVDGCRYRWLAANQIDFKKFSYLLLNDTHRLNFTEEGEVFRMNIARLPNFKLTSYEQMGFFQCVIFDPNRMRQRLLSNTSSFIRLNDPVFDNAGNASNILSKTVIAGIQESNIEDPFLQGCTFNVSRYLKFGSNEIFLIARGEIVYQNIEDLMANLTGEGNLISYSFPDIQRIRVQFEDEGLYQCVLNFSGLTAPIYSQRTNIEVKELVTIPTTQPTISRLNSRIVFEGCTFTITIGSSASGLNLDGFGYIEIDTLFNGTRRINAAFTRPRFGNVLTTLAIQNFTIDSFDKFGTYRCAVFDPSRMRKPVVSRNSTFTSDFNIQLPNITKNPESSSTNSSLSVGEPYRIKGCQFKSTFQKGFDAYWLKDNKRFLNAEIQQTSDKNVLLFKDLVFDRLTSENNGTYSCVIDLPGTPIQFSTPISIVLDVLVANFTSSPKWKASSDKIEVVGCKYQSTTNLNEYVYLLFNGAERVDIIPAEVVIIKKKILGNGLFEFEIPSITITSFEKLGTYQFIIENKLLQGRKIASNEANIKELKVTDFLPTFKKHPKSIHGNVTGGPLTIEGCQISSKIPLGESVEIYYLKNGVEKIDASSDPPIKSRETFSESEQAGLTSLIRTLSFLPFKQPTSEYTDQGFYQCGLKIPGLFATDIFSNSTDVQFIDVAAATVEVRMEKVWDERLNDVTSIEFRALKQKIETELVKNLPKQNGKEPIVQVLGFRQGSVISLTQVLYTNVSNDVRVESCSTFQNIGKDVKLSPDLNVKELKVKSLDCCKEDKTGEDAFKGVEVFPETLVSVVRTNNCTYRQSSRSQRQCVGNMKDGPTWSEVDSNDCPAKTETTNNLISLSQVNLCSGLTFEGCQTPIEVTQNLSEIVNKPESITTRQDLSFISIILRNIALHPTAFLPNDTESAEKITINILQTVSTLIASDRRVVAQAQRQTLTSESIVESLDMIAQKIGDLILGTNKTVHIETPNVAFIVKYVKPSDIEIIGAENWLGTLGIRIFDFKLGEARRLNESLFGEGSSFNDTRLSSSKVPFEAFQNSSNTVFSYFFRDDTLFQDDAQLIAVNAGNTPVSSVASNILAVTVGKTPVTNLSRPISFKFKKTITAKEEKVLTCTFWNPIIPTSFPNVGGKWMVPGCQKVKETKEHVVCECNHLTNFAILLDVSQTGNNPLELRIITWIGCGISLAGLALTLLTYMMFKKLRQKLPPKILMSLSFSLMVLLIVFLVGVERETVGSNEACQVVSGILHYFMLTTFMWMLVEAVNLYRNFVKIFRGGSDSVFFMKASLFAWGIPLVIVVINGAVKSDSLGNDQFCVVHGNSFYYGLLIPVAATLLINFIVLIMVMKSLTKSNESLVAGRKKSITGQARIAFACCALLGVTWVFALFAIGDLRDTFQWLFTIFNSLQGLFIFLFYTLRNVDAKTEWKRLFHIDGKRQDHTTTTSHNHTTLNRNELKGGKQNKTGKKANNSYELEDHHSTSEIDLASSSTSGNLIQLRQFRKQSLDTDKNTFKEI